MGVKPPGTFNRCRDRVEGSWRCDTSLFVEYLLAYESYGMREVWLARRLWVASGSSSQYRGMAMMNHGLRIPRTQRLLAQELASC